MKKFFSNLRKYFRYALRSARAELRSEVADSHLNWLWWVIEPLCFMLIYTFVFGVIFGSNEEYFAVFVFVGLTAWDFFNRMVSGSVQLIMHNRGLVTKVYVPKYVLLLAKSFTYLFKLLISWGLTLILMLAMGVPFTWYILLAVPILAVLYLLSFGMGMILMHFGVYLDDLSNLVRIALKMIFYLSGVFYNIRSRLGGTVGFILLRVNPIAFFMDEFRKVFIGGQLPSFEGLAVWLVIGIFLCIIGVHIIHKNENTYAKII